VSRFTADDGIEIYYREWGAEHADSGRPPVFLHHGFLVDGAINWELPGVAAALVAAGHRVIAPDARGHGRSGKPHDPARYGEARMAADLDDLFDELGVDSVHLAGYSMGAVVSLVAASTNPRITRLAIGGVGGGIVQLGGVDRRVLDPGSLAAALRSSDPSSLPPGEALNFRRAAEQFGNDLEALACQADSIHRSPIDLAAITAPTLVLAGRDDPLAAEPELLSSAIPGARLQIVDGDHMSAVGPQLTAALVEHFA